MDTLQDRADYMRMATLGRDIFNATTVRVNQGSEPYENTAYFAAKALMDLIERRSPSKHRARE
jgi:hypothetical protein